MARTLASNRSRAIAADRLLDDDPDPARDERRDPYERVAAEARHSRALVDRAASTTCGATLTLATRSPRADDLAVEGREDLERVDPVEALEVGDPDVEHAGGLGQEVDPALRRTARIEAGPGHRRRQPERGIVLVELARLDDEDAERLARLGAGERDEVVGAQPAALDQRAAPIRRSRARMAPASRAGARRPGVTRRTCTRDGWLALVGRASAPARPRSRDGCRRRPWPTGIRCRHGCRR